MPSITLDTSALPADDLRAALEPQGFDFAVVSVTHRELRGSSFTASVAPLTKVPEAAVWDESEWDEAVWGDQAGVECLERALAVMSSRSFPPPAKRASLTAGEHRQLRDAMIFCAHVRERRDIFVTSDTTGFIDGSRREQLAAQFHTRIMTRAEFVAEFCPGGAAA